MKKIKYYCDKCNKEIQKEDIIKKEIPTIDKIEARGGKGNPTPVLLVFENLVMDEYELCKNCADSYEILHNYFLTLLAQQWSKVETE